MPSTLAGLPADVAIPQLVDRHGGQLYRLALRFCGTPADAEDLVQQTFLQAFRKWHQFKGDAAPTTWLYTIAARQCERTKRLRSGEPRRLESLDDLLPSGEPKVADLRGLDESPYRARLRHEAKEALEAAIAKLPMKLRMTLVLKDIVELSLADVAKVLGLKLGTVKTRVHRARLMLRRDLSAALPRRHAPEPTHARQRCLDLLRAKQEALDHGVPFLVPQQQVCERCAALFATLDLGQEICRELGRGRIPPALRQAIMDDVGSTRRTS